MKFFDPWFPIVCALISLPWCFPIFGLMFGVDAAPYATIGFALFTLIFMLGVSWKMTREK